MHHMYLLLPFIASAVPTALYTLLLWWLDRYEKEPLHLLLITFIWGAVPALLLALAAELFAVDVVVGMFGPGTGTMVLAPVVEETLKAVVLVGIYLLARREWNGVLDGIIYGALVGFGFAMSENMLYFMTYSADLGVVWLLRSVIFGFNHAFFSSMVGIALGFVRYEQRRWAGYVFVPLALGLAILAHMLHNASAQLGWLGLGFSWLVNGGGVLIVIATALLSLEHELRWINSELQEEVEQGVITPQQLHWISHPSLRSRVELRALLTDGWLRFRRLRRLHHLLTELAFVKYQLRCGDRFCCPEDVPPLRAAITATRRLLEEHHAETTIA
jgi:RsiW-degrading membrane proteinase PrsW (M82 family)